MWSDTANYQHRQPIIFVSKILFEWYSPLERCSDTQQSPEAACVYKTLVCQFVTLTLELNAEGIS